MTSSEIYEIVSDIFTSHLHNNEVIWSDIDQYECLYQFSGNEPTWEEIYSNYGQGYGLNFNIAAQCFAGALGNAALDHMLTSIQPYLTAEQLDEVDRLNRDHIFYYIDELCRQVESLPNLTARTVRRCALAALAHERRHSVQDVSLLDMTPAVEFDDYINLSHEADADAFAIAVIDGEADVEHPEAWRPEALYAA